MPEGLAKQQPLLLTRPCVSGSRGFRRQERHDFALHRFRREAPKLGRLGFLHQSIVVATDDVGRVARLRRPNTARPLNQILTIPNTEVSF
jgi:hypothetical protein